MENSWSSWWIYALLSAFFSALTTIFAKIGLENIDANIATAIRTLVILIIAWGIVFVQGTFHQLGSVSAKTVTFLVISGIATGLSWLFYFRALQLGKAAEVLPIDKSSVFMVVILSAIFLQEPLSLKVFLGGVLIAIGTLVLVM
jgi:transporter family protein